MEELLRKLFKIHKGEGAKVFHFALLGALLQAGVALGVSTSDSLFLVHVGVKKLPYLYIIMPLVMLVYITISAYLLSRYPIENVLYFSLAIVIVGSVMFYDILSISGHVPSIVYYFAKIFSGIWFIALYTLFWSFTDCYFDLQDAKRLFPIFSGGGAVGAMIGGLIVRELSSRIPVAHFYLVWVGIAALSLPVLWSVVKMRKKIDTDEDTESRTMLQEIRDTSTFIRQSRYVRIFLSVLFIGVVLNTINELQYSEIFQYHNTLHWKPRTEQQIAEIFGNLFFAVNIFNLIVNFFLFNRMVAFLGIGNMTMIGPIAYVTTFTILLLNFDMNAGIIGFFTYQGIITSIDWNNANFLFNAVPLKAKTQVRTFAEGLVEPVATATAGCFLLFVHAGNDASLVAKERGWSAESVSLTGLIIAGCYIVISLILRSGYLGAIVSNLKQEWLDFSQREDTVLTGIDIQQQKMLAELAITSDTGKSVSAMKILWYNNPELAADCLLNNINDKNRYKQDYVSLLEMMLKDEDPEVIRKILVWLDSNESPLPAAILEELGSHSLVHLQDVEHLYNSSDPLDRAAAIVASWSSWSTEERLNALQTADHLLKGTIGEVAAGIRAIGRSKHERYAHFLLPFLFDNNAKIRHEALIAVYRLVNEDSGRIVPYLLRAIEAGNTEERVVCMNALSKIGSTESVAPLLALSGLLSPYECRRAELALRTIGLKSVPAAVAVLRDSTQSYAARSVAARSLANLAFPQLELLSPEIIETEIKRAYEIVSHYRMLEKSSLDGIGASLLARFYRDMQSVIVDFVLELLSVGGRLPDFELISASLRSDNRRERGNAIETIEQGVDRPVFKMLLPLVDIARDPDELVAIHKENAKLPLANVEEIIGLALNSNIAIETAIAAQALWELNTGIDKKQLRSLLRETSSPLVRETIISLITSKAGSQILNPVERIKALHGTAYFKDFHISDLESLIHNSSQEYFEPGTVLGLQGEPIDSGEKYSDCIFVAVEGSVTVGERVENAPCVFGGDSMYGVNEYKASIVSNGVKSVCIPVQNLIHSARIHSRIGLSLLAGRI